MIFPITEKAPTNAFSWLKGPNSTFTFKQYYRHCKALQLLGNFSDSKNFDEGLFEALVLKPECFWSTGTCPLATFAHIKGLNPIPGNQYCAHTATAPQLASNTHYISATSKFANITWIHVAFLYVVSNMRLLLSLLCRGSILFISIFIYIYLVFAHNVFSHIYKYYNWILYEARIPSVRKVAWLCWVEASSLIFHVSDVWCLHMMIKLLLNLPINNTLGEFITILLHARTFLYKIEILQNFLDKVVLHIKEGRYIL